MDRAQTTLEPSCSDAELLAEFVRTHSDGAFSELVLRHKNWVYSAALRQVRKPEMAEDVTQAVFVILARKAGSLKANTHLSGWLFHVLRHTAIDAIRMESRRSERERIAAEMNSAVDEANWDEIFPLVDECLSKIRAADQRAILLRYYERKSWREVGAALDLNENSARVRVDRALDQMRRWLRRRGAHGTLSGLSNTLMAHCVQSAPVEMIGIDGGNSVTALVRSGLRRFLVKNVLIWASVVSLFITVSSFLAIPISQNAPPQVLLGAEAFAALDDIDRGFWTGNPVQFLSRIHFRGVDDEKYRQALGDYIVAEGEFRQAAVRIIRDEQFSYYKTLDVLLSGRSHPTQFGVRGDQGAGAFSRGRGIDLIRVNKVWKWNFFKDISRERLDLISQATLRLRSLTEKIASGADASEITRELKSLSVRQAL